MGTLKTWIGSNTRDTLFDNLDKESLQEHEIVGRHIARPQQRATYDINVVKRIINLSPRYKTLKVKVKLNILEERQQYGYLKQLAINNLEGNLRKQFTIFSRMISCDHISKDLLHNIFSWNWKDFLLRRKLNTFVWVDILLRMETKCLHAYKYRRDLDQLEVFVKEIFDGLLVANEDMNIIQHIEEQIDEAKKSLLTADYVEGELNANSKKLRRLQYKEIFLANTKRLSERALEIQELKQKLSNTSLCYPVEVRYMMRWYQNIVKQEQIMMEKSLEKCKDQISFYIQQLSWEKYIDGSYMDFCYTSIEMLKNRIVDLQATFDKSSDEMDSNIIHARLKIEKVMEQRKFLADEIERFHEEENKMKLQAEKEEEKKKSLLRKSSLRKSSVRKTNVRKPTAQEKDKKNEKNKKKEKNKKNEKNKKEKTLKLPLKK